MLFRTLALVLVVILGACQAPALRPAQGGYFQQKVVYHVSDIENARRAMVNINNHLNLLGEQNAEIVLVSNGSGVLAMVEGARDPAGGEYSARIHNLMARGVQFQVCEISLRAKKIDPASLVLNTTLVPSGVVQLGHLQQLGYGYIRP